MNSKYYQISFEAKKISRQRLADGAMNRVKYPIHQNTQILLWVSSSVGQRTGLQSPINRSDPLNFVLCGENVRWFESIAAWQFPYLSGHPFLQQELQGVEQAIQELCQSPIYRDTHFYRKLKQSWQFVREPCVNPLSIGTPISTKQRKRTKDLMIVSIPYLSGHPFLQPAM